MASIYDKASLVLIPSGTKTSKVYSQVPTNGDGDFTFSRSTAATRVNASGNIEKETQNLLKYSGDLTQSQWQNVRTTDSTGHTGYDGTNNAFKIIPTAVAGTHRLDYVDTWSTSQVYTFSIYAKADGYNTMAINIGGTSIGSKGGKFNLSTGVATKMTDGIDAVMTSVGSGWYRCSIAMISGSTTRINIAVWDGDIESYTGDGTSGILVQHPQFEYGLVARDYIETTTTAIYGGITDNVPRLDYTDSSCPALLLEPQRTNQVEQSEYGGSTYWSPLNSTITDNAAISPEGVQNAFELTDNSTDGYHWIYRGGLDSGNNHRISFFAKANTLTEVWSNGGSGTKYAGFNLSNGTIFSQGVDSNATIEDYGNGWYRCSFTSDYSGLLIAGSKNGDTTYIGTGQSLYLYGIQSESAASYPTSYIPTYGSAVTRNADRNETTPNTLISSQVFSMFFEYTPTGGGTSGSTPAFELNIQGTSNNVSFYVNNSGANDGLNIYLGPTNGGYLWGTATNNGWTLNQKSKVALTYDGDNLRYFINGVLHRSQTGVSFTNATTALYILHAKGNEVEQALVFPTALTDQEAIDLTTL